MQVRRARSWVGWVASACAHAVIAVLVWRAGERAPVVVPPEIVELDFEIESPPVGGGPSPSPRQAGRGDKKEQAGRGDKKVAAAPAPSRAPISRSDVPAPRGAGEVVGGTERGGGASPAAPVDLSFSALPDDVKGRFGGPRPPEGTVRARPGRPSVDELRVELERREDAVANVEKGRADPVLYDYLRGARARFLEQADRLANDLAVGPGTMVRGWGRGYLKTVEDVNRGVIGARVDAPREGGGDARNEKSAAADVLGQYGEAQRQAEAGAEVRRAEVCLDVAAGRGTGVTLRRTSGNAALDRLALESFTKAVAARPVPDDARRGLACYELFISAYRMPPLPFVSCGVGRAGLTCVWPFKKVTSVKGRLLSVDYPPADGEGDRAGPALLRRPR